jgi:tetratricopeptide (TPR) repeat protein
MENYYEILGVPPDESVDKIQKNLYQQMRVWSHRTNAPQMERRQEAERMVRLLEEIEEILLDESRRTEYDQQLQAYLKEQSPEAKGLTKSFPSIDTVPLSALNEELLDDEETPFINTTRRLDEDEFAELLHEGQTFLKDGALDRALEIAERLTQEAPSRSESWAFLGQVRWEMKDIHESMTAMIKARDLDPQNAEYVGQLGHIFLKQEDQKRAREQFKRAVVLDPDNLEYKYYLGLLYLEHGQQREGLNLLEQCVNQEPDNEEYRRELSLAYLDLACKEWEQVSDGHPYLSPGLYPTERSAVKTAEVYLDQANRVAVDDIDLRNQIHRVRLQIQTHRKRRFTGSWWMFAFGLIFLIVKLQLEPTTLNAVLITLPLLYLGSALTPSYRIYREEIRGKSHKTDFAYIFVLMKERMGTGGAWFVGTLFLVGYYFFVAWMLALVIIRNVYKNYLFTS